ncbi:polysaccharide deacetylase family protein [Pontibacter sp. E15-1]|uniref:polysaccharide deacetylase family protein n=1 Tax=Pontibacter sp. E15-1 TaxID=2919918 RepID=UPI001F4FE6C7|nr:polysaccharide deacetylase family protein [Pontibacter sp. E15-1]MCJ8163411.1 polysaccharide deacetylase family protein [Pontibacter sp. E15-1]
MNRNLEQAEYSKDVKWLIVHADDAGLSCSENRATVQALSYGVVNSYSIMMPCPWALEMVDFARSNPRYDCGIHLTLTCEWKFYKFRPVLPPQEVASLVDPHGYFHSSRDAVKRYAKPEHVRKELRAQIEKAIGLGLRPTHLDTHMFALGASSELLQVYKQLGEEFDLPILLSRQHLAGSDEALGLTTSSAGLSVDHLYVGEYKWFENEGLASYYDQVLDNMQPGLNTILIHPAFDDAEMQGLCVEHPNFGASWRQADFDYFTSARCVQKMAANNIRLTTWAETQVRQAKTI